MIRKLWPIWIMLFYVFLCNVIKAILLHLISSFLLTRSSLVPYTNFFIESIDCILISSFELKAILVISSVKTLWFSLINLCFVFDICFFMNSFLYFLRLSSISFFFEITYLLSSRVASKLFLLFSNLSFYMTHFFVPFPFLSSLPSSIK